MALTDKLTDIADAIRHKTGRSGSLTLPQMVSEIASIHTGIMPETKAYSQMNPIAESYLKNAVCDPSDYSQTQITSYAYEDTGYRKDRPAGVTIAVPKDGVLTVTDGVLCEVRSVSAGSYTVENLIPGRVYQYSIQSNADKIVSVGLLSPMGQVRMINAGGNTFNIRDLGGWSCDGGTLRYGMIYRGCELNGDEYKVSIAEEQKRLFTDFLGIRDEIDLRGNGEVDGEDEIYGTADDITTSVFGTTVGYVRYPVLPYASGIDLSNKTQTGYYAALLRRIASDMASGKPCYIHCLAGADRTGTLCALIEALCGVSQSDIDKDYELTSFSYSSIGSLRRRTDAVWVELINAINAFSGSTFRDKAVSYALQAGVSIDEINALRAALIDGTPEILSSPYPAAAITKTLTNITTDYEGDSIARYQPYEMEFSANDGYVMSNVSVSMDGVDITDSVFEGTEAYLRNSISKTLTNCSIDNEKKTIINGESYVATITPNAGCTLSGATVSVIMGGVNMSNYYSNGKIVIPRVTGNLVITADAIASAPFSGEITDSWATIAQHIKSGAASAIYGVGSYKSFDVTLDGNTETIEAVVAGFYHDNLASGQKAPITFVFRKAMANKRVLNANQKDDVSGKKAYNAGGWSLSELRTWANGDFFNALPSDLKQIVCEVSKISDLGYYNQQLTTTTDKVFALSLEEVGLSSEKYYVSGQGAAYDIFTDNESRTRARSSTLANTMWFLRSSYLSNGTAFWAITMNGEASYNLANDPTSIVLGFCVG